MDSFLRGQVWTLLQLCPLPAPPLPPALAVPFPQTYHDFTQPASAPRCSHPPIQTLLAPCPTPDPGVPSPILRMLLLGSLWGAGEIPSQRGGGWGATAFPRLEACPFLERPLQCEPASQRARQRRAASVCPEGRAGHFPWLRASAAASVGLVQRVLRVP